MNNFYWAALGAAKGILPRKKLKLAGIFGNVRAAYEAGYDELMASSILTPGEANRFLRLRDDFLPEKLAETCTKKRMQVISIEDASYPELLKGISVPPLALFVQGELPQTQFSLGVVGSRKCSLYGKKAADMFSFSLGKEGILIVSGGARGIDTAAHRGALRAGAATVAVMGCGLDIVYPKINRSLFAQIRENGALVSEFLPGTEPLRYNFPRRNRIIAGLSKGILLVEAAARSGALITADYAVEENRDVFCVPGNIFMPQSVGAHRLLKAGAGVASEPKDIVDGLFPELYFLKEAAAGKKLSQNAYYEPENKIEAAVIDLLTEQAYSLEELAEKNTENITLSDLSMSLLQLQMKKVVAKDGMDYYHLLGGKHCE